MDALSSAGSSVVYRSQSNELNKERVQDQLLKYTKGVDACLKESESNPFESYRRLSVELNRKKKTSYNLYMAAKQNIWNFEHLTAAVVQWVAEHNDHRDKRPGDAFRLSALAVTVAEKAGVRLSSVIFDTENNLAYVSYEYITMSKTNDRIVMRYQYSFPRNQEQERINSNSTTNFGGPQQNLNRRKQHLTHHQQHQEEQVQHARISAQQANTRFIIFSADQYSMRSITAKHAILGDVMAIQAIFDGFAFWKRLGDDQETADTSDNELDI